jgi:hypothetical protein
LRPPAQSLGDVKNGIVGLFKADGTHITATCLLPSCLRFGLRRTVVGPCWNKALYYMSVFCAIALFVYGSIDTLMHAVDIEVAVNSSVIVEGQPFVQPTTGIIFPDTLQRSGRTNQNKPLVFDDAGLDDGCNKDTLGKDFTSEIMAQSGWLWVAKIECAKYHNSFAYKITPEWQPDVFESKERSQTRTCNPGEECGPWQNGPTDPASPHACQFSLGSGEDDDWAAISNDGANHDPGSRKLVIARIPGTSAS